MLRFVVMSYLVIQPLEWLEVSEHFTPTIHVCDMLVISFFGENCDGFPFLSTFIRGHCCCSGTGCQPGRRPETSTWQLYWQWASNQKLLIKNNYIDIKTSSWPRVSINLRRHCMKVSFAWFSSKLGAFSLSWIICYNGGLFIGFFQWLSQLGFCDSASLVVPRVQFDRLSVILTSGILAVFVILPASLMSRLYFCFMLFRGFMIAILTFISGCLDQWVPSSA